MKHISRNKLIKKKPSQTVTATPEKLKGGAVRGAGLGWIMLCRWQKEHRGLGFTAQFTTQTVCWALNALCPGLWRKDQDLPPRRGQLAASITSGLFESEVAWGEDHSL